MKNFPLLVFLTIFCLNVQAQIQLSYYLPNHSSYDQSIPTPESVLGYQVGKWHVSHDKLVFYLQQLAESSDRIKIETIGKTFEDRPLIILTITSPENHQNLENIRTEHIKATENDDVGTDDRPIVVYQGFTVHGNEPSGTNAAMLAAYHLAASNSEEVLNVLKNTVVLLDACMNPDGFQRFTYWVNTNKNKNLNPDPNDREYDEIWPGGRTNHYWFDMNRDWLPAQLPESRARLKIFHKWMPNILTDHHEMGKNATFFFQPGIPSRTHPLTPKLNQELTKQIGNFHAKAFDKISSLYYTEESFDDFYYGKGSTFPDINGSIGILFEQASSRGHIQESDNGLLTFPYTIKNQLTATLSTLEAAVNMKTDILEYQQDFFKNARKEASAEKTKAIIFGDSKDASKTYHLAEILKRHKIDFHELKNDVNFSGKSFKKGFSYVVPKNQKNARLINAMFEKRTSFQDSLFYDVSAWTLPLAFGLDYSEDATMANAGELVKALKLRQGKVSAKSNYAYLMEWHDYYTPKALNAILSKKLRAKVGMKTFSIGGKDYDYGTILIPIQNQVLSPEEIHVFLTKVAKESHVNFDAVGTGLTSQGIDLGSNQFRNLEQPKVAMIVGDGIRSYDAGEIWHLFDQRYDITLTKLDLSNLGRANLSRYNTIILPSGYPDTSAVKQLKSWVESGGQIIGYRSAINWLKRNKFINFETKRMERTAKDISFEQRGNYSGAQYIGGAIFETKIDRSHPINFGYKNDKIAVFRNNTTFIKPDKQSYNNPIQYTENPLLSGYISKSNLDSLALSVPFKSRRMGRGKVTLFNDNTNFRAFWYGTNKLLMNAIFFRDEF
ncbi:MAG: M14 family metallopeptidase [Bacteroidota bacterium]